MGKKLLGLVNRLKEPSSWAGIGVVLIGVVGVTDAEWQVIAAAGSGLAGLIAMLLKDPASEK